MANEIMFAAGSEPDNYYDSGTNSDGFYIVGDSEGTDNLDGAIRFPNVTVSGSVVEAQLYLHVDDTTGSSGSGDMDLRVQGIDEDNTALFTGNPFGRTGTTATVDWDLTRPNEGDFVNKNVTDIVNEILGRGGWSSGNAMGFFIRERGTTPDDTWFSGGSEDVDPSVTSCLVLKTATDPNFYPTPSSVSAPTIPTGSNYVLWVSKPGFDVKTATEDQLAYNSDQNVLKIYASGTVAATSKFTTISHDLGYAPMTLVFYTDSYQVDYTYRLPYTYYSGDVYGFNDFYYYVNSSEIRVSTPGVVSGSITYYIFIDEQP